MSRFRAMRGRRALALLVVAGLFVSACGDDDDEAASGDGECEASGGGDSAAAEASPPDTVEAPEGGDGGAAVNVALLLPETATARYETQDRPLFEARLEALCPDCILQYFNAEQDAAEQQSQAEAALTDGADVLVLDPVDGASAGGMVELAEDQGVPVVSYDRLISDAPIDFYISYDNVRVGELQAEALVDKLEEDGVTEGDLVMINGAPTDNNASQFKEGAHNVLDDSDYEVAVEYDTPDWSPDEAQSEMDQALTELGPENIVGVYAANDGTAGGAISAMEAVGVDPLPPVTGQDAEVAGIQRILVCEQYMTVYKAIVPEAGIAADVALALGRGEEPPADLVSDQIDNGAAEIPSQILTPEAISLDNVNRIIEDDFWTVDEICTADYEDACADAGIS